MAPSASIIIPTRDRPDYLAVALASIAPQARAAKAELIIVDDGRSSATEQQAGEFGGRYVALGSPRGLNAARNAGIAAAQSDLLILVDDDVEVADGWLAALLAAAKALPDVGVFGGPIRARLEGSASRRHSCGREAPPITNLDLGAEDRDVQRAWGANLTLRRSAFEAVGPFDVTRALWAGDEEEWEARHLAAGGRIRYVAAAALDHRRSAPDATRRALARGAYARGVAARRYDAERGDAPSVARELRTFAGCIWHTLRRRCANGPLMAAHSAGRIRGVLLRPERRAPSDPSDDFLTGESGTVGGKRDVLRRAGDLVLDVRALPTRLAIARAARREPPTRRVLFVSAVWPDRARFYDAAVKELRRSRHEVTALQRECGTLGRFENFNVLLASAGVEQFDWLFLLDDDVVLPRGFLDGVINQAERHQLRLVQPAHRLRSHAAWRVTRRRARSAVRETAFVEIGPVVGLHRETFDTLLPFPPLRMGWGLDAHWSAVAAARGWRIGIVDALPVGHRLAPAGATYSRQLALDEARAFLADHPYLPARELQRTLVTHRRCA